MKSAFDEIRSDDYEIAEEPRIIGEVVVERVDSHAHLQGAMIGYLFRDHEVSDRGKAVWASAHLPKLQGAGAKHWGRYLEWSLTQTLGFQPDFVLQFDRNVWEGLDLLQRCAITEHELKHCIQAVDADGAPRFNQLTGAPVWAIAAHDVEEFDEIMARYGAWKEDLVTFSRATIDALSTSGKLGGSQVVEEVERRLAARQLIAS